MTEDQDFSAWIGRTEEAEPDIITPRLVASFAAMLAPHLAATEGAAPGLHWCLAPGIVAASGLGPDGHPAKGGFLPPVLLPRRMWAGGELEFLAPLHMGDSVQRSSRIRDIAWKTGKSGALCFVTVTHEYATARGIALREAQSIVYRPAAVGPAAPPAPRDPAPRFDAEWQVDVNSVTLFRYSALTFNGHRIHYDLSYAKAEFYPDLVVHGPLQATLLLNLAASLGKGVPRRFSYRGISPATGAQTLRVGAKTRGSGTDLSLLSEAGCLTMTGLAEW